MKDIHLVYQMILIRRFEEFLLNIFEKGQIRGTTHTYMGQEAIAVGLIDNLSKNDTVISNHRCHGHYIAKTRDITGLLAEILGKDKGICRGRGGSQHLYASNFFSNGVQGNMFPVAAGLALAEKRHLSSNIITIFIGDGTLGEGVVYETLNLIGLLQLPILIVVENNQYAQSTPLKNNFWGDIYTRLKGFNILTDQIATNDVFVLHERYLKIINDMKKDTKPRIDIVNTYRLGPHSKGDDDRPKDEIEKWKEFDPISIGIKFIGKEKTKEIEDEVNQLIRNAYESVKEMKYPTLS